MPNKQSQKNKENFKTRPPVVVILGHIDHGKTSLLEKIRHTGMTQQESGGITQHVGAYQVEHRDKKITFIDTPGHEAFYAMRSRGAKVADIAVLVVAADDGIMPQTKEAIKHVKHADIPMVVAINKIDRQDADSMKVKNQLLEEEIIIEEMKGDVPAVEVSASTGQGIEDLLDMINLVSEVEEIKANTDTQAQGAVIEAELNHQRGPTATLLVKEGTLKEGDIAALSSTFGKIKNLENFRGEKVAEALPGDPVLVTGLSEVPRVGEKFVVEDTIEEAEKRVRAKARKNEEGREVFDPEEGKRIFNLILKADSRGTLEAVHEVLRGIQSDEVVIRVLSQGVGEIMESDVKLASTANALILGFRTKMNQATQKFANQMKVDFISGDVIYEIVEKVRAKISDFLSTEIKEIEVGEFSVLAIFYTAKSRMIVGGRVLNGEVKRGNKIRVFRNEEELGRGRVSQLKIQEKVVEKVDKGKECGLLFEGDVKIQVKDVLKAYEKRETKIEI